MTQYNKTQLHPETCLEKHVFHRDQFAHVFRWSHVLKRAELGMNILDFGCGTGNLAELLYRNRFKASIYLGLDVRKQTIKKNIEKYSGIDWIKFQEADLCNTSLELEKREWDIIASFEVLEHIGKQNVPIFLNNIKKNCSEKTIVLLSTPCYDEVVGAAGNHTYDSGDGRGVAIHELTYFECEESLKNVGFNIINKWGTFASKKDYKKLISPDLKPYFDRLNEYYDDNLISNLMAPLFPEHSRNVLWECKI